MCSVSVPFMLAGDVGTSTRVGTPPTLRSAQMPVMMMWVSIAIFFLSPFVFASDDLKGCPIERRAFR
jgi:hypothetical protein